MTDFGLIVTAYQNHIHRHAYSISQGDQERRLVFTITEFSAQNTLGKFRDMTMFGIFEPHIFNLLFDKAINREQFFGIGTQSIRQATGLFGD